MRGAQFHALDQQFRGNRSRAHRQRAAQCKSSEPSIVQQMQAKHRHDGGDRYLGEPKPEYCAAHAFQLGQAEFQADREHQENDAELGKAAYVGVLRHPAKRAGTDRDADRQIPQDWRQTQKAARHHNYNGCRENDENQLQRLRHRFVSVMSSNKAECCSEASIRERSRGAGHCGKRVYFPHVRGSNA